MQSKQSWGPDQHWGCHGLLRWFCRAGVICLICISIAVPEKTERETIETLSKSQINQIKSNKHIYQSPVTMSSQQMHPQKTRPVYRRLVSHGQTEPWLVLAWWKNAGGRARDSVSLWFKAARSGCGWGVAEPSHTWNVPKYAHKRVQLLYNIHDTIVYLYYVDLWHMIYVIT